MKTKSTIRSIITFGVFAVSAHANIITNPDFESGSYSPFWNTKNAAYLGSMSVSSGANHTGGGINALRVSGRSGNLANQAGPSADILNYRLATARAKHSG